MFVVWLNNVGASDKALVGGKGAHLGEVISKLSVPVPEGFVITTLAFKHFIRFNGIKEKLAALLQSVDVNDLEALEVKSAEVRQLIEQAEMPPDLGGQIKDFYNELSRGDSAPVAVRSSAVAEDLEGASFAGQQETYLNVKGLDELIKSVKRCFSSLFTPRAIAYRHERGFRQDEVEMAVIVQRMVNPKASGVAFSLHPHTGDRSVILLEASWGLGELVVQGRITPDQYIIDKGTLKVVDKKIATKPVMLLPSMKGGTSEEEIPGELRDHPCLTDGQAIELAKLVLKLEGHYGRPQDVEWALDAETGALYILQTRPETVWSTKERRKGPVRAEEALQKTAAEPLLTGLPASPGIASGPAHVILDVGGISGFKDGEVLVTRMTAPDWVPAMRKAAAIVTDTGGMTSHAAIVSRELGKPCVVGTGNATQVLKAKGLITVDGWKGLVYEGTHLKPSEPGEPAQGVAKVIEQPAAEAPITATRIYVNLGIPDKAEEVARLPVDGVGLMRIEFIISSYIGMHPLHMIEEGKGEEFVEKLAEGIAKVARAFYPRPVVVRFSDFKTNEYRELKGGEKYEVREENPMLGWRGASRYVDPAYEPAFRLEVRAMRKVREQLGLKNAYAMVPFVRTPQELERILAIMRQEGLERGKDFQVWMMCEVPSNVILVDRFAPMVDAFSIGSNDLTQLILGVDRDSEKLANIFDERDEAVTRAIGYFIREAHKHGCEVSICGQAPSVYREFAEFLVRCGIDSISVNPDAVYDVRRLVAQVERRLILDSTLNAAKKDKNKLDFLIR